MRDEADALKVFLAGVETRFRDEHTVLVQAINELKAMTKAQNVLLEALCAEVKTMREKIDALCSHTRVVLGTSRGTSRHSPALSRHWVIRQKLFRPSSRV